MEEGHDEDDRGNSLEKVIQTGENRVIHNEIPVNYILGSVN